MNYNQIWNTEDCYFFMTNVNGIDGMIGVTNRIWIYDARKYMGI